MTLRHLKIGLRLALGFGALMAIILVIVGASIGFGSRTAGSVADMKRKAIIITDLKDILLSFQKAQSQTWAFVATSNDQTVKDRDETLTQASNTFAHLEKTLTTQVSRDMLAVNKVLSAEVRNKQQKLIDLNNSGVSLSAPIFAKAFADLNDAADKFYSSIGKFILRGQTTSDVALAQAIGNIDDAFAWSSSLGIAGVLLGTICAWIISRSIARPIKEMTGAMTQIAAQDFTAEIPDITFRDEVGVMAAAVQVFKNNGLMLREADAAASRNREAVERERAANQTAQAELQRQQQAVMAALAAGLDGLARGDLTGRLEHAFPQDYEKLPGDFNATAAALQSTLSVIIDSASAIDSGSDGIARASDGLSKRTEQQAAGLEETAATLNAITGTVKKMAAGSGQAAQIVAKTREAAEASGGVIAMAIDAMEKIKGSSAQITNIIGVIDEIAFQTNLLALNAGVEAARAGDAGRGFAVVASEVRALAQRSAEAAKQIKGLISASTVQVDGGVDLVGKMGETLRDITGKITDIDSIVHDNANALREQATSLSEVNTAMREMDDVVQQNAAMVEESTAAAFALKSETQSLAAIVGRFRVEAGNSNVPPGGRARAA